MLVSLMLSLWMEKLDGRWGRRKSEERLAMCERPSSEWDNRWRLVRPVSIDEYVYHIHLNVYISITITV